MRILFLEQALYMSLKGKMSVGTVATLLTSCLKMGHCNITPLGPVSYNKCCLQQSYKVLKITV